MKCICCQSYHILHGKWKEVSSPMSHASCSRSVLVELLGGELVTVTKDRQDVRMLSSLLKGMLITQRHTRETGDFWESWCVAAKFILQ